MRQNRTKTETIKIRISEDDKQLIKLVADRHGKSISDFIREIISWNCRFQNEPRQVKEELLALRKDLNSGVGNNINQFAHKLNAGGKTTPKALERLADDFHQAKERINLSLALFDGPIIEILRES